MFDNVARLVLLGTGGVRIENSVLITADDPIVLTSQAPPTNFGVRV
ncbi:hypothetical protein ACFQ5J_03710 [Lacticaseibacillus baoqingensis]|uniref:Uncharacterized protein n=1 Tax=Lacticaseibacillus baoqingensis TaxID=2486013 RepID=A0ABW4E330_9LACO|nr:hypothetical protein [Lacticaseibacillus baoqingensis]